MGNLDFSLVLQFKPLVSVMGKRPAV